MVKMTNLEFFMEILYIICYTLFYLYIYNSVFLETQMTFY